MQSILAEDAQLMHTQAMLVIEGVDFVHVQYQTPSWLHPRTVVGIRQHVNKRLLGNYSLIVLA